VGHLGVGPDPMADQRAACRRALSKLGDAHHEEAELLPPYLGNRPYLDLVGLLKNNLFLVPSLRSDSETTNRFVAFLRSGGIAEPWLAPYRWDRNFVELTQKILSGLVHIYEFYEESLREHNRIDFDDQKLLPYQMLKKDERLRETCTSFYDHVVVDEFQDINRLDFELIALLSRSKSLVVVGDDDQAIYAFRGCSPRFITEFPALSGRETEQLSLSINYRCPRNLVELGCRLIRHNQKRIDKQVRPYRQDDADVKFWHMSDPAAEAQVIARHIKKLAVDPHNQVNAFADFAVLYRMNAQSLPLQLALILEGVPYHCRREENVVLSDAMGRLVRLLRLQSRCLQDGGFCSFEDTELLVECLARGQIDREAARRAHGFVEAAGGYGGLLLRPKEACREFGNVEESLLVSGIQTLYRNSKLFDAVKSLTTCFRISGIMGSLQEAVDQNALPLGELGDLASRFKGTTLEFCDLLDDLMRRAQDQFYHRERGESVELMTYFRSKGRQWPTVFLPGVNQSVIPGGTSEIEDERRLFYVAVTRATHNLTISYVRQVIRERVEASQFLKEMGLDISEQKRASATM